MKRFIIYLKKISLLSENEEIVFLYGLKSIAFNFFTILNILVISFLLFDFKLGGLTLLFFIPIRLLSGGYHCKSPISCIICFDVLFIMVVLFTSVVYSKYYLTYLLLFLYFVPICISAEKQHLIKYNYNAYKKYIVILYALIMILCNDNFFYEAMYIACIMNAILISTYHLKN